MRRAYRPIPRSCQREPHKGMRAFPFSGEIPSPWPTYASSALRQRKYMRHFYIDGPRRLPAPRAVLLRRTRFAPVALALPLVTLMWLTIGLPIFAELSSPGGQDTGSRDVVFGSGIPGRAAGGGSMPRGHNSGGTTMTIAAATVSPAIAREVGQTRR